MSMARAGIAPHNRLDSREQRGTVFTAGRRGSGWPHMAIVATTRCRCRPLCSWRRGCCPVAVGEPPALMRWASGGRGLSRPASTGCSTSRGWAAHGRSVMTRWNRSSSMRSRLLHRPKRPTGRPATWPSMPECHSRRCRGSGAPSVSNPTSSRPGICRLIRSSSTRCATLSGSTSTRRNGRWCCVSTRSPRCRRSSAPARSCRCCPPPRHGRPTTTSATAPWTCSPRSM